MPVWAVLPVKGFDSAKSRLRSVLAPRARARLARALFEHVLGTLRDSELAGVVCVTPSAIVAERALSLGAVAVWDPPSGEGLAASVEAGLDEVARRGARAALVAMSDLPCLSLADIAAARTALDRTQMLAVRDQRGTHTNLLGIQLTSRCRTHFGAPDSFQRHCEEARRAALSLATPDLPGFGFDLDLPEDVAELAARLERQAPAHSSDKGPRHERSRWSSRPRLDSLAAGSPRLAGAGRSWSPGR